MRFIENADLIERIFGGWPSFHDAEVHRIVMTRDGAPELLVTIHHWLMTDDVDANGRYVLKDHTLTTLRFSEISELKLDGFNHQNVLWELEIAEVTDPRADHRFEVSMPSSFGCEASFKCNRIAVVGAAPYSA